jgi:hypothetical protein
MQRSMVVAGSAVLLLALGAAAAAGAAGPGLSGETFSQTVPLQVTRTCDPSGNSTITFTAQGTAAGPFAGTFTETGSLTLGPQNLPQVIPGSLFTVNAGQVLTFDAHFTIDSPAGQVSGDKTVVVADPGNQAACVVAGSALVDLGLGEETCTNVDNATAILPALEYTATIHTTTTSQDNGGSTAQLSQFIADCPLAGSRNQSSFQEAFFSTTPLDTPGRASGGGMIASPRGPVTFGFNAKSTGTSFSGGCSVNDRGIETSATRVKCLDVTSFAEVGNTATLRGDAEVNGVATAYTMVVQDNGEPNTDTDTFAIQTDSGYSAGGQVIGGNVQVS